LTPVAESPFHLLLALLDPDRDAAAGKYELLRQRLVKCIVWKGCSESESDALADTVLDRVAAKVAQGESVQNVNAYACQVMRFVWLEHIRRRRELVTDDGEMPEVAIEPDIDVLKDPDLRLRCLRKCMAEVVPEERDRILIVGYYDTGAGEKNKDKRRTLADQLGMTLNTMKVRACRIRERLERCINECVERLAVTKTSRGVTNGQGGSAG
jgi:DNA-directed RNA polymerase specialized sigma24 family protein